MAEAIDFEMRDLNRVEIEDPSNFRETSFDLPDTPLDHQTTDELSTDLKIDQFISNTRKSLNLKKDLEKNVYKGMTIDKDGYLYYKQKRISIKGGKNLTSIKTSHKIQTLENFCTILVTNLVLQFNLPQKQEI